MKSKTSLFDRAVLFNDLKRFAWIGIVYLLGLLFTVPLMLYIMYLSAMENGYPALNYLNILSFSGGDTSPVVYFLILGFPVLTGIFLFRYLQSSKSADMVHALPIRRTTLYNTHMLAGFILLFVPLLITALVSWAIVVGMPVKYLSGYSALVWLAISLLVNLIIFTTCVTAGMITGKSVVQGFLTFILLCLPIGIALILHNVNNFIYGFAFDYYVNNIDLSPIVRILEMSVYPIHTTEIFAYIFLCILLYFLGSYLYQQRELERAGNAFTFDILYPICKYGVAFCGMLLLGSFLEMQTSSLGCICFAYLLGSFMAYMLMEILFKRSPHVFNLPTLKGYGIFALIIILLLAGLSADVLGYEKKMPALADVESVYMDNSFYSLMYRQVNTPPDDTSAQPYEPSKAIYKDQANIDRIYELQQHIIANRVQEEAFRAAHPSVPMEQICLAYTLKNGGHIYRRYTLTPEKYDRQLKAIRESPQYKKFHYDILAVQPEDINLIQMNSYIIDRQINISDPQKIQQAVRILQAEVSALKYEDMQDQSIWSNISFHTIDNHEVHLSWNKSYKDFEQWLKANQLYEQIHIVPNDLAYAIVTKNKADSAKQHTYHQVLGAEELSVLDSQPGRTKVTDRQQLADYLQKYTNDVDADYQIVFVLNNGQAFYGYLSEGEWNNNL